MFFTVHQWEFRFGSVCRHSDAESTQALLKVGSWVVIVTIGLLLKGGNVRRQGFQVETLEVSSLLRVIYLAKVLHETMLHEDA